MACIVYFSTKSGNTRRFVEKLDMPTVQIPCSVSQPMPEVARPFVLVCPTYADGEGKGAVPKQVIAFLNKEEHRANIKAVVGSGNRNFGEHYAVAGDIIAHKCKVPMLYRFELMGTPDDVSKVKDKIQNLSV